MGTGARDGLRLGQATVSAPNPGDRLKPVTEP